MAKEYWFDEIHDNLKILDDEAYALIGLARAFRRVGNNQVAEELEQLSEQIRTSSKSISGSIGMYLTDEVDKGQKEITNMFNLMLGKK